MKPGSSPAGPQDRIKTKTSLPVATFGLLIVVIAAVAAVGMITDPFSLFVQQGDKESPETAETESPAMAEIIVSGSTTVKPVSDLLAEAFMEAHEDCKVTVKGGGSGAGVSSAGMGIVDIGSASRGIKGEELLKYPDIQVHTIGGSAVVVILNGIEGNFVEKSELIKAFNDTDGMVDLLLNEENGEISVDQAGTTFKVYQRSDESGTEETFASYLETGRNLDSSGAEGRLGNEGVLVAVEETENSMGFVDFGFAEQSLIVSIAGVELYSREEISEDSIKAALEGTSKPFPSENSSLTRPLNYLTKGKPDSLEHMFIDFARSPEATVYFEECGYFSIAEI